MAEHNTLTGSSLHEPKGVASATSGQVYVADGASSGAWTTIQAYGGMVLNDGTGSVEINSIGTTAQKITSFTANMPYSGVIPDYATDSDLTVPYAGDYAVKISACLATVAAGDAGDYTIRFRVNGAEPSSPSNIGLQRTFSGSGDLGSMGTMGFVTLAANDVLTIWIESDEAADTDDLAVHELSFWCYLIKRS